MEVMSRIAEGLAKKGSQKWLQRVVNEAPEMLNAQLKSQFKTRTGRDWTLSIQRAAMPTTCIHLHAYPGIPKEFP
jgi:hypothetical protein